MSSYYTRYCGKHGDWDQDIDNPYEECPACTEEGCAPSQVQEALIANLRLQLSRAKEWMDHGDGCPAWDWPHVNDPCTCGLTEFLKEIDHEHLPS